MSNVIKHKTVKTKKDHKCFGCGRKFEKGSILTSVTSVDGGEISTNYWCDVCNEYWDKFMDSEDLIYFGDLKANDFEEWESIRVKLEGRE